MRVTSPSKFLRGFLNQEKKEVLHRLVPKDPLWKWIVQSNRHRLFPIRNTIPIRNTY